MKKLLLFILAVALVTVAPTFTVEASWWGDHVGKHDEHYDDYDPIFDEDDEGQETVEDEDYKYR